MGGGQPWNEWMNDACYWSVIDFRSTRPTLTIWAFFFVVFYSLLVPMHVFFIQGTKKIKVKNNTHMEKRKKKKAFSIGTEIVNEKATLSVSNVFIFIIFIIFIIYLILYILTYMYVCIYDEIQYRLYALPPLTCLFFLFHRNWLIDWLSGNMIMISFGFN